jgi:hypothetical protein
MRFVNHGCGPLPNPDTPLWPQLVPLLSYRLIGDGLREGEIPASVVTRAVSGPIAALKALIEVVNNASTTIGRPDEESRKLYDVVAKRFAYNSFEIAFDLPLSQEGSEHTKIAMPATLGSGSNITPASTTISIQSNFPEVPSAHHFEFDRHLKLYQEGAVKLNRALEWLMTDDDLVVPPTLGMLTVLENLVPPKHGQITAAEIKGKLIGASSSITLTRDSTNKVRRAIADSKERQRTLVTLEGRIGEFDKDKLICTLRDRSDHSADTVCSFSEAHYDDLYDAFNTDKHVVIHGRWPANRRVLEIVAEEIVETPRIS